MKRFIVIVALVGCQEKKPQVAAKDAGAIPGDAGGEPGDDDLPDEASVRAGKRTGLEAPDAKPEVATEPLARALLGGEVPWSRFVDPAAGVVVLRLQPDAAEVARRCGPALDEALRDFAAAATAALADTTLLYDLVCDNVGLAVSVPGVVSHAMCSVSSPSDGGTDLDLIFVPDPARGLRLVGTGIADATLTDDALLDRFDEEMGRYGAKCP